jgi:hypothetical protein
MSFEFKENADFEVLHFNRNGFVGLMKTVDQIQVGCGIVIVTMGKNEFLIWNTQIEKQRDAFRNKVCHCQKYFMFTTGNEHVKLMLSWKEMD